MIVAEEKVRLRVICITEQQEIGEDKMMCRVNNEDMLRLLAGRQEIMETFNMKKKKLINWTHTSIRKYCKTDTVRLRWTEEVWRKT